MAFTIVKTKGNKGVLRLGSKGKFIGFSSKKEAQLVQRSLDKRKFRNTRIVTVSKARRFVSR